MASFVESATLRLIDEASGKTKKVNKELRSLEKTAKAVAKAFDGIKFKTAGSSGLSAMSRQVQQLERELQKLRKPVTASFKLNTSGVVGKLADIKRAADFVTTADLRLDTSAAEAKLNAFRGKADNPIRFRIDADAERLVMGDRVLRVDADSFSSRVQSRVAGWGQAFANAAASEIAAVIRQGLAAAGRKAGEGIMSLSDADLNLQMAVGNRPNAKGLMDTIRSSALELSTGEFQGLSQAKLIELGAEAVSGLKDTTEKQVEEMMRLSARNATILTAAEKNAERGAEQARVLNKINSQLDVANDPARARAFDDAILKQRAASGADFNMQNIQNMLQQIPPALRKALTPEAVARLGNIREEGGRQSTADVRMAFNELMRGNLNETDKRAMAAFGLRNRDLTANRDIVNAASRDPVQFALDKIAPKLLAAGVDINNFSEMQTFLDERGGFTTTGAKFWADIIGSREQIAIGDTSRRGANIEAALAKDASLRQSLNRLDEQFQNFAARATQSLVPIANDGMQTLTDVLAKQASGEQLTAADWAGVAAGVTSAGLTASIAGLMDPATRPLSLAALALTSSAGALTGAAGTLAGAGIVNALGGAKGGLLAGAGGLLAGAGRVLGRTFAPLAVAEGLWSAAQNINAESINLKVANAAGITDFFTRLFFGDEIANRPDMPANNITRMGDDTNAPQWIKDWNRFVTTWGRELAANKAQRENAADARTELTDKFANNAQARIAAVEAEIAAVKRKEISVEELLSRSARMQAQEAAFPGKAADDLGIGAPPQQLGQVLMQETANFKTAITGGATQITQAGSEAGTAIANGALTAGGSIRDAIISAGQTAASAMANAINSAAANVRVNVTASKPLDTGANQLSPRNQ